MKKNVNIVVFLTLVFAILLQMVEPKSRHGPHGPVEPKPRRGWHGHGPHRPVEPKPGPSPHGSKFNCKLTTLTMVPCVPYLTSDGGDTGTDHPSFTCCIAVSHLKATTRTRDNRRNACACLKNAAALVPDIDEDLVASLPKRCHVHLGFTIGNNVTCSKIP